MATTRTPAVPMATSRTATRTPAVYIPMAMAMDRLSDCASFAQSQTGTIILGMCGCITETKCGIYGGNLKYNHA